MRGVNAAPARCLRPLKSKVESRAEFCADHGFHPVEDVRQIVGFVCRAAPVGRFCRELNKDLGLIHWMRSWLRIDGLPFRTTLSRDARRIGHLIETRPEWGVVAHTGIVDFVSRRIHDASLAPEVELLLRIGDGVRLGFRPLDQLRLGAVRKRGLHDVVFHKCAGNGV